MHNFAVLYCMTPKPAKCAPCALTIFGAWWRRLRAKGSAWLGDLMQLVFSSPREFLDAHFESEKLKVMVAAWGMHLDFAPDIAGGALFSYFESMAEQSFGMAIGQGGSETVINALVSYLRALGGEVHLGRAVERIEHASGCSDHETRGLISACRQTRNGRGPPGGNCPN